MTTAPLATPSRIPVRLERVRDPRGRIPRFLDAPLTRWLIGVVGPAACFLLVLGLGDFGLPLPPQAFAFPLAAVCITAQVLATLRPARGGLVSALLCGILVSGVFVALLYACLLTPIALIALVFMTPLGLLGLMPVFSLGVYARAAWIEGRSVNRRAAPLALIFGLALPASVGGTSLMLARHAERAVIAEYVDSESPRDPAALRVWRPIAWLHDWDELGGIVLAGPFDLVERKPIGRAARAGEAWSALTGRSVMRLLYRVLD